jgi:L-asparagine transporter-like permease
VPPRSNTSRSTLAWTEKRRKPARCLIDSAAIEALGAASPFDFAFAVVPEASAAAPPCYFVADKASHSAAASTSYCFSGSRMREGMAMGTHNPRTHRVKTQ